MKQNQSIINQSSIKKRISMNLYFKSILCCLLLCFGLAEAQMGKISGKAQTQQKQPLISATSIMKPIKLRLRIPVIKCI